MVPDGEEAKSLDTLGNLLDELAALRLSRDDVVVAVGGGAITISWALRRLCICAVSR